MFNIILFLRPCRVLCFFKNSFTKSSRELLPVLYSQFINYLTLLDSAAKTAATSQFFCPRAVLRNRNPLTSATDGTRATATSAVSAAALVYGVRSPAAAVASGADVRSPPQPPASSSLTTARSESEGL